MNAYQAMADALRRMQLGQLEMAFGSAPKSEEDMVRQVEIYYEACESADSKEGLDPELITSVARKFLQGRVTGVSPSKFPTSAEFSREYASQKGAMFEHMGISVDHCTVWLLQVPILATKAERRALMELTRASKPWAQQDRSSHINQIVDE